MAIFQYKAFREDGQPASGIVAAETPREARDKLRHEQLQVTTLAALQAPARGWGRALLAWFSRRPSPEHLAAFTRELATLLEAGIPLADALGSLAQQAPTRRSQVVILDLQRCILGGQSFSLGLSAHPGWFDELYVSIIAAAEASGSLDETLARLAGYITRREKLRARISAALAYPAVMISVSICVLIFLITFVVPRIVALFEDQSLLPLPTRALMALSHAVQTFWPVIIAVLILGYLAFKLGVRTRKGGLLKDRLLLRLPLVGEVIRKAAIARFVVTFASLLRSGIPAHEALLIVKNVIGNRVMARAVETVHERVLQGADISTPMMSSSLFPPTVAQMVGVGERTGRLPDLLERIAQSYEDYVEASTQKLTSLLEPVIIVVMAFFVAYIVLSVLLPVLRIGLAVGA